MTLKTIIYEGATKTTILSVCRDNGSWFDFYKLTEPRKRLKYQMGVLDSY